MRRHVVWIQNRVEEVFPEYKEHGQTTDDEQRDDICGVLGSSIRNPKSQSMKVLVRCTYSRSSPH